MADNVKPEAPAQAAGAPLGEATEKQSEPVAAPSTEVDEKGLEASTEKKDVDELAKDAADLNLDEKKPLDPMPIVAPQPAVGVESMPTEASQKASDQVPITTTGPSTVPTVGDSGTAAGAAGSAPGVTTDATGAVVSNESAHAAPAASAPATSDQAASAPAATGASSWPETAADHPLTQFYDAFELLTKEAAHNEVYGVTLSKSDEFHTKLILQKFLRANANDLEKAKQQLLETLKWRKDFDPTKAAAESFDKTKFDGLGYIIEVDGVPESENKKDIVTFNIYGAVKDNKATFGDLEAYVSPFFFFKYLHHPLTNPL